MGFVFFARNQGYHGAGRAGKDNFCVFFVFHRMFLFVHFSGLIYDKMGIRVIKSKKL